MQTGREETPWKEITLFLLTLGILFFCALVLHPFLMAITGAIVLGVITERPYNWLSSKIKNPSVAATIALILVALALVIPSYFLAQRLGGQVLAAIAALRDDGNQQKFSEFLGGHPAMASHLESISDSIDVSHAAQTAAAFVGSKVGSFLKGSFHIITQLVVMLFILFFLFRDRPFAVSLLRSVLPLREGETSELIQKVTDTIYATALGRLAIAGVQGVLAGLAFWVLGVQGAILWGFTTVACAMIPSFGSFLVWGPIAVYLGLSGHWGKAVLLAVWGGVVVSTIDNILYPMFVGTRLRSHTVTILLSILGGIAVFGITGIILGPVIFTIADTLLDFWRARTNPQVQISN